MLFVRYAKFVGKCFRPGIRRMYQVDMDDVRWRHIPGYRQHPRFSEAIWNEPAVESDGDGVL